LRYEIKNFTPISLYLYFNSLMKTGMYYTLQ
jgi:hypothetical protein